MARKAEQSDVAVLKARAEKARLMATTARTSQDRQHYDGMASYWEELLAEAEVGAGRLLTTA